MATEERFVIVGASQAGTGAAQTLREEGFPGRIVLIGDEIEFPYQRPPLSKDYLLGNAARETVYLHPRQWYLDNNIDLRLDLAAVGIDRDAHRVSLADGSQVRYAKLLLTTGSSPRRLPLPGVELHGVHYLRRMRDSDSIKTMLQTTGRVAVIGAGWIGLETAAAARAADVHVTVLDSAPLPLLRVLGAEVAQVFADLHLDHGVDLRLGVQIAEITGHHGHVDGIRLSDGTRIEAESVIIGAGIAPNTALALQSGLTVDNGILVDEHLQTSDPDIYAAGDVANAFHPLLGKHIRVEHWANALHQPQVAAKAMLGQHVSYDRIPYFYTDQYDLGMEYVGYVEPDGYDQVVFRGDVAQRQFLAFWLREGRVLAGMNVNIWDVTDQIQALIRAGAPVLPDHLADPGRPLESFIAQ
ncbi:3-phenylpropionate/trans-cinnamate dioxygenase ferredoxin reductase subunit [Nakamurella panacisegetis]|uniref:3-phenylpropionate/trans-cinnamate dioxygenase ferredoxin reductase subunit n=1 Tax=Nakamurella panacisegetis TaxID=1090615 RepID=A0A1H0RJG6_9ACTN|nr:FAD-dependent oxidoreductase [Nakamurella panacisegetis]SDP29674.1 3-phenylpropionate/trans-cinnamate dioxygenase ferredoxin reductase subunit [Nakamurella panacisegetis]